jgi:hypothetical protein
MPGKWLACYGKTSYSPSIFLDKKAIVNGRIASWAIANIAPEVLFTLYSD